MMNPSSTLIVQDEVYEGSLHLDEVMLSALSTSSRGAGAFAFATRNGINAIFNSDEFKDYCKSGKHFELLLGIDAVTNDKTLAYVKKLTDALNGRLIARVYYDNSSSSIFHPKTCWFADENPGNGGSMFVGSGNLTLNGLQNNTEMFSWIDMDQKGLRESEKTWNRWLQCAQDNQRIYAIDDPLILERAKENSSSSKRTKRYGKAERGEASDDFTVSGTCRAIVATMPMQQGRESQFVMPKAYYTDFFGFSAKNGTSDKDFRVLMRAVASDGLMGLAESRAGSISRGSSNYRIELDAARSATVQNGVHPILVAIKTGPRDFLYEVFDVASPYLQLLKDYALRTNRRLRGNELPKCMTNVDELRNSIPNLPIFHAKDDDDD